MCMTWTQALANIEPLNQMARCDGDSIRVQNVSWLGRLFCCYPRSYLEREFNGVISRIERVFSELDFVGQEHIITFLSKMSATVHKTALFKDTVGRVFVSGNRNIKNRLLDEINLRAELTPENLYEWFKKACSEGR